MEEIIAHFMKGRHVVNTQRKCTFCKDSGVSSSVFCLRCKIDLCTKCVKSHTENKLFSDHKLTPFTGKTLCSIHKDQLYTLHCVDCNVSLCDQCDTSNHLQHRLRKPEDIANERSFMMEQAKLRACELSCRLLEQKHEIQDKIVNLKTAFTGAVEQLATWRDTMIRAATDTYQKEAKELDNLRKLQLDKLEDHETHIGQLALLHQELADFIELVQSSPAIELAQQQEGIAHMFPVLSISHPPLKVPQPPELKIPEFKIKYKEEPMYEFITLSDDDYLEEDNDIPLYANWQDNDESDPRPRYENWEVAKSLEDISAAAETVDDPQIEKSCPSEKKAVKRVSSSRVRRNMRQLSLEQVLQGVSLKKVGCLNLDTKVYDVKWNPSVQKFIVRTGDAIYPLKSFSSDNQKLESFSKEPLPESHIGLCIDSEGGVLCTLAPNTIRIIDKQGGHQQDIVLDQVDKMRGIAYCLQANAYLITDTQKKSVLVVDAETGSIITRLGGEDHKDGASFQSPLFITCDNNRSSAGIIAVSDRGNHCVKLIDLRGSMKIKFGRQGSTGNRRLKSPAGIWMDPSGAVVVCDWGNKRVVRFGWDGTMETLLNTEQLDGKKPFALDISPVGIMAVTTWEGLCSKDTIMIYTGYTSADAI